MSETLRAELEAVLAAVAAAARDGDAEAFLGAVQPPGEGLEEALRADFERSPDLFIQMVPNPAHTIFVAVRAEGGQLAAYYHLRLHPYDPCRAQIVLSAFVRAEGRWKLLLRGTLHNFDFEPETDFLARGRELVATEPALQLRPPTAST